MTTDATPAFFPYTCATTRCDHPLDCDAEKCGTKLIEKVIAMAGNPELLSDARLAATMFPIFSTPEKLPEVVARLCSEKHLELAFVGRDPNRDEIQAMLKIFECYLRSMGYRTQRRADANMPTRTIVVPDSTDADYGFGPGAAAKARASWLKPCDIRNGSDDPDVAKNSVAIAMMIGLLYAGCRHLALELYATMMNEYAASRRVSDDAPRVVQAACLRHVWEDATTLTASRILVQFRDLKLVDFLGVDGNNKSTTPTVPPSDVKNGQLFGTCRCNVTPLRFRLYHTATTTNSENATNEESRDVALCAVTVVSKSSKFGCSYTYTTTTSPASSESREAARPQ